MVVFLRHCATIRHWENYSVFGVFWSYRDIWPMSSGKTRKIPDAWPVSALFNRSLIPTIILPLCRTCIQQMPNMNISQILVQLITLVDGLILYVTKFIHQHRWVLRREWLSERERVVSFARIRNSAEELASVVNWSHIDGLFDLILTIRKQTLIETDEHVRLSNGVRFLSHSDPFRSISRLFEQPVYPV